MPGLVTDLHVVIYCKHVGWRLDGVDISHVCRCVNQSHKLPIPRQTIGPAPLPIAIASAHGTQDTVPIMLIPILQSSTLPSCTKPAQGVFTHGASHQHLPPN